MNLLLSNVIAVTLFSLLFFLLPIKIKKSNKLLILFLSLACSILGQTAFFLFSWWIAIVVILVLILCITILVGGKIQWFENQKQMKHELNAFENDLPKPMFSYDLLKEKSAQAKKLDFSPVLQGGSLKRETMENEITPEHEEVAAAIDNSELVLTTLNLSNDIIKQERKNVVYDRDNINIDNKSLEYPEIISTSSEDYEFDADIKQMFKNRVKLFEENQNFNSSNKPKLENVEAPLHIRKIVDLNMDEINNESLEDLQFLYERLKENRERG